MTREKIQDRIRKLLKLAANNPSVEEAAVAFEKAQALANIHALDLHELDPDGEEAAEAVPAEKREVEPVVEKMIVKWKKVVAWKKDLVHAVARANGCQSFYTSGSRWHRGGMTVFGQASDVATVEYIYAAIEREMDKMTRTAVRHYKQELHEEYGGPEALREEIYDGGVVSPRAWGRNFRLGAVHTIAQRLRTRQTQLRDERKAVEERRAQALAAGETQAAHAALALATNALARVERASDYVQRVQRDVEEYHRNRGLVTGRGFKRAGGSGYAEGRVAGQKVGLGNKAAGALKGSK